jgi:hypothetical protein
MPLEAPCQGIPDIPILKFKVAHTFVIGVAQNAVIKNTRYAD